MKRKTFNIQPALLWEAHRGQEPRYFKIPVNEPSRCSALQFRFVGLPLARDKRQNFFDTI